MEKGKDLKLGKSYRPPRRDLWKGRKTNASLGAQYWYQHIELKECLEGVHIKTGTTEKNFALLGYACNEGVRRNQGRIGAKSGPNAIRKKLAGLAWHFELKQVFDLGDLHCEGKDMEACQERLSVLIAELLDMDVFPIVLGGGHDMAFGHFMGIHRFLADRKMRRVGIINFDAHFDLRPVQKAGNSGTPFYQIAKMQADSQQSFNYFVIGIQKQSNTKELFQIASNLGVKYVLNEDCQMTEIDALTNRLAAFIADNDYVYISIDMDGFSSVHAPGVSAASPLGLSPSFVFQILKYLFSTKKIISCDIAELNPDFDIDGRTANLAARLVDYILEKREE